MRSFEYFLKTVKNERWDPSQSIYGPWNDPEPFFEANEQLANYIDSVFGITPEMWDTLMDKDKSESYMKLEDEVSQKFSDLYQKDYVIGYNSEFDAEEVNDEYKKLSKEIETELKDLPYPKRAKEFNYRLNKAIFDNHLNEFKEIYSKYFTLSESVFKIQKPNQEAFTNVVDGKGTCTECGAENVPVENHVCTTKISEASENSIIKKVNMVNQLIKLAIDEDGDPIPVVDTSGTWQAHNYYEPVVYSNGGLIIKYKEGKDIIKDRINKSDMEYEGIPTLNNIAKMYRRALKQHNIKFNENLTIDELGIYEKLSKEAKDFISKKIAFLIDKEGRPRKQAIAMAYSYAKEKGFDVPEPKKKKKSKKNEAAMITSLKQFKKLNENADAEPDVEKLNQELDIVHSWLKGTTEPFDDWFWDGHKLSLYINGTDEPIETYTRQELIDAGVNLSAE